MSKKKKHINALSSYDIIFTRAIQHEYFEKLNSLSWCLINTGGFRIPYNTWLIDKIRDVIESNWVKHNNYALFKNIKFYKNFYTAPLMSLMNNENMSLYFGKGVYEHAIENIKQKEIDYLNDLELLNEWLNIENND
jgi:hypothetical protein